MSYAAVKARLDEGDVILLDGGIGTELERRGVRMDPAAWCGVATLGNDELLTKIHVDYAHAGSDILTANTYASSRLMLDAAGHTDQFVEINTRAVEAALKAQAQLVTEGRSVAVAGSLSHAVPMIEGTATVDQTRIPHLDAIGEAFAEMAATLKAAGAEFLMLEMMYEPTRTKYAIDAALSSGLPVWFGMSGRASADGKETVCYHHFEDLPLDTIASLIPRDGIDVAGAMHTPSERMADVLAAVRNRFDGPLSAYPDSGYFQMPDWQFVDIIEPADLEVFYGKWLNQGARVLGGCCGLTVPHIEAAARARTAFLHART